MWLSRRRTNRSALLVRPDSILLIEAPMRSGNTFAVAAFWLANGRDRHVGRHIHTAAHVLEAVRLKIPVLVIVRDPRAVAVSHVLRRPALTVRDSLIDYVDFYRTLDPVRDSIVSVDFQTLVSDFPAVIDQVNAKFETLFTSHPMDEAFQKEVTLLVEEMNKDESVSDGKVDELRVARPSAERDRVRSGPESELARAKNRHYVERAVATFERWQ